MTITFHCTNILEFDSSNQRYVHCGHVIQVPDSKIGTNIKCPNCQQMVEVPVVTDPSLGKTAPQEQAQVSGLGVLPSGDSPVHQTAPESGQLSYSSFGTAERCPKCGGPFKDNRCGKCGYELRNFDQRVPINRIKIQPTGFAYFLNTRMSGMTGRQLAVVCHVIVGILSLIAVLLVALTGGITSFLLMVPLGILIAGYVVAAIQTRKLMTVPAHPLNWWQRYLWDAMLSLMRARNFNLPKQEQHLVLTVTNKNFSDADLDNFEQTNRCRVLELSDTTITDRGLFKLHNLVNLRFVILHRTAVTPEGVFRLQQSLPRVWIWY